MRRSRHPALLEGLPKTLRCPARARPGPTDDHLSSPADLGTTYSCVGVWQHDRCDTHVAALRFRCGSLFFSVQGCRQPYWERRNPDATRTFISCSVEIIANDQGNRTTPSYVAFTDTERLIGDAAKNQVRSRTHTTESRAFAFNMMLRVCRLEDLPSPSPKRLSLPDVTLNPSGGTRAEREYAVTDEVLAVQMAGCL